MLHLVLNSCDSCYAQPSQTASGLNSENLPEKWQLLSHQIETLNALRNEHVDVVVNTAMTGDGKTLAAQLMPLLDADCNAMFMYPTNELLRDQFRGLANTLDCWPPQAHWPTKRLSVGQLNAFELDEIQAALDMGRANAISQLLHDEILLTNPDIFHLLIQMRYQPQGAAEDFLLGKMVNWFRLFVFDEFHLFGAPQVASALIAVLLLKAVSDNRAKFLFLSATPQLILKEWASKAGLNLRYIEGQYRHGESQSPAGYRRILREVDIYLWEGKLEDWVDTHLEDTILNFFATHRSGAKGVIIANSVATAHRLYAVLQKPLEQADLSVGLNTGLTGQEERRASREKDLIIGTSTIDVGVDFHINLLIFESIDAASHLQRLGRLGRHADDGAGNPFEHFEAHALLPAWVIASVEEHLPTDEAVARPDYHRVIEDAFPSTNQFRGYEHRWASVQAAHVLYTLGAPSIKKVYEQTTTNLGNSFAAVFGNRIVGKYRALKLNDPALLDEATSFRGSSPFTGLVLDTTREQRVILPYNLLTLLQHGELQPLDLDIVLEQSTDPYALERHNPLAAYKLCGWLPKSRPIRFEIDARIEYWEPDHFGMARVQTGFTLDVPGAPGMLELNRKLKRRELVVTLVCGLKPNELRRRLRLGWQLQIHDFKSLDNLEGCAAFGRDALLLDTALSQNSSIDPSGSSALIL